MIPTFCLAADIPARGLIHGFELPGRWSAMQGPGADGQPANESAMATVDLCGRWELRRDGEERPLPATVPGCVHTDLPAAGEIPDPFFGKNAEQVAWVGETAWTYSRAFELDAALLERARVLLECEGLDTLATIRLNGKEVGRTDNMFRCWKFDIKPHVHAGTNEIEIRFESTLPHIAAEQERGFLMHIFQLMGDNYSIIPGGQHVRKCQSHYGWDWGPKLVTCGIWRPIRLVAFDAARIEQVRFTQDHATSGLVRVAAELGVERVSEAEVRVEATLRHEDTPLDTTQAPVDGTRAVFAFDVRDPKLWWPNGMGEQPLYEVEIRLLDAHGRLLDSLQRTIGLRTLRLEREPDDAGQSFQFVVNGTSFFAKGANWIPADSFLTRASPAQYEHLVASAAAANMNMLRVWGGGIYEQDCFYDLCDRYGLCVWQDFMFACSAYPSDPAFLENVRHEAEQNVKRLRHHACLALWCGNNEIEMIQNKLLGEGDGEGRMTWAQYKALFDELLPGVVRETDPERDYWPSSSHSPLGDRLDANQPGSGDAHLWAVWSGNQPPEWYRTSEHRFCSEFGFQSFPEPDVVATFTAPADREVTSEVMTFHQRQRGGNRKALNYLADWFRAPADFEMQLWLSQILQGLAVKCGVEHWRRRMPQTMGALYWQLNDCWPGPSWASIDWPGNWKALQYMARRFFASPLVTGLEDAERGSAEVHVTNDGAQPLRGAAVWTVFDMAGAVLLDGRMDAEVPARSSASVGTIELGSCIDSHGADGFVVWLELEVDGTTVSSNLVLLARPKALALSEPNVTARARQAETDAFAVSLSADKPALWVWPELPGARARYSDRFFHLLPGRTVEVLVRPERDMDADEFQACLKIHSLWNACAQG